MKNINIFAIKNVVMEIFKTIRSVFSVAILLASVLGSNNLMAESKDGSLSVDICAPESEDDSSETLEDIQKELRDALKKFNEN